MEVTERLNIFITEYCGMSVRQFEKKFNFSNGSLMKVKGITLARLLVIVEAYPEINIEWLFLGKGEMIKKMDVGNLPEETNEKGKDEMSTYIFRRDEIHSIEIVTLSKQGK